MKNVAFLYSEKALTQNDIHSFEIEFDVELPSELRELLLEYNGGVFEGEMKDYAFSFLFPIKYGINNLEDTIDSFQITEQHIPRLEIPFAGDQGGNVFTISTAVEDYGAIYYWELDVGDPRKNFVADSLTNFFKTQIKNVTDNKGSDETRIKFTYRNVSLAILAVLQIVIGVLYCFNNNYWFGVGFSIIGVWTLAIAFLNLIYEVGILRNDGLYFYNVFKCKKYSFEQIEGIVEHTFLYRIKIKNDFALIFWKSPFRNSKTDVFITKLIELHSNLSKDKDC